MNLRIRAAKYWIENFATEDEKTRLQETLPARAQELTAAQGAFLHKLAELLPRSDWEGEALQVCIFNAARLTPIDQPSAFKAIYRVLLDRANGPKAGNLLSFLNRDFVVRRCSEPPVDQLKFWQETAITQSAFAQWLEKEKPNLKSLAARLDFLPARTDMAPDPRGSSLGIVEVFATLADGKTHCKRVLMAPAEKPPVSAAGDSGHFSACARQWIGEIGKQSGLPISLEN